VPGNGTFNLTALWRALGIKNPQPTFTERVQPVIVVQDFSLLTPQHRPATASFRGDVDPVVGEFTAIQVTSRSPGGTLVPWFNSGRSLTFRTGAMVFTAPIVEAPSGLYSRDPIVSEVITGSNAVAPAFGFLPLGLTDTAPIWIPQGGSYVMQNSATGQSINNWSMFIIDLPASDNPQA